MGGTVWNYTTAYREDVRAALSELQREVYSSGNYMRIYASRGDAVESAKRDLQYTRSHPDPDDPDLHQHLLELAEERLAQFEALPEPETVEDEIELVRQLNTDAGTHSILDIRDVSDRPGMFHHLPGDRP